MMVRSILLISHGELAVAMKSSVELIIGEQPDLFALPMNEQDTLDSYTTQLERKVNELLKEYDELLILADIKGGTPCNAATRQILTKENIHLISGYHLGLVIESCLTESAPQDIINNTNIGIAYVNNDIKKQ